VDRGGDARTPQPPRYGRDPERQRVAALQNGPLYSLSLSGTVHPFTLRGMARNVPSVPPPELPWSWHKSLGWRGQLARVQRWQTRLHETQVIDDAEDYSIAFFQGCYHLRDWVLFDQAMPRPAVDLLFNNHAELRICGDLCNATKHRQLSFPKQSREFSIGRAYRDPGSGWFGPGQSETFTVLSDGQSYEVLSLVDTCVNLWITALRLHHADI